MLRTTPLHAIHRERGAKLVAFGGWDMPLHYGSQIEEHHAVRRAAGMFDVSHMRSVEVLGPDAAAFLRRTLANDVARLDRSGRALYSCMLNASGGVVDDLIVYRLGDGAYRLVVNAGNADADIEWLDCNAGTLGVTIVPRTDLAMIAVQGPQGRALACAAIRGLDAVTASVAPFHAVFLRDWLVARTGYTGEDGFEIMLPAPLAVCAWRALEAAGVKPCGLGARDTLRLEAGMNLHGQDMDDATSPLECGLGWTVDMTTARDFIGRAALAANPPHRAQHGLLLLDQGVLRAHQAVRTPHGDGVVTSGSFSPTLARSIALARLPAAVRHGDRVEVDVRGKALRARVVPYPFVRNGASRIDSFLE